MGEIPPERQSFEAKVNTIINGFDYCRIANKWVFQSDYAQVILEKPMYAMMKLSVLFFFRRIFLIQKRFRWYNDFLIIIILLWGLAYFLAEIFVCGGNPTVLWNPTSAGRSMCVNQTWLNFTFAITDVIGDILVVVTPYPCIRKLQMGRRQKLGIAFIFLLGTLSTIASIIRLYFVSVGFTESFGDAGNKHSSGTPPTVWSTVEGAVGVLAACLPPLGPLIKRSPSPRAAYRSLYHRLTDHLVHSKDTAHSLHSLQHPDSEQQMLQRSA